MASDYTDCPTMLPFRFRYGEIKGDVSILAAPEGESAGDEWHDVPTWGGMPRYADLLAERDRLKAYVESMARMTTPEDEFNDPEHKESKHYDDADDYRSDFSDDRMCEEFAALVAMIEDARKLLNGEATADTEHVAPATAAPTPQFVHVVTIDHSHGTNVHAYADDDAAQIGIASYCREWWDDARREFNSLPETPDNLETHEIIELYFNVMNECDEFYTVERVQVEG